jgi:branched-chain amino acid transport system substrate-binding protein
MPGDAAPVTKIGVIAPFEGTGRPLGYAVLPGIEAAVEEANASGDLGRYRVLVVAFNDDLDAPTAAAQARALALDADVLGVVGPWTVETTAAAKPILAEAGLPALAAADVPIPSAGEKWGDAALAEGAALARQDARLLLDALAADIRVHGQPTRGGVAAELKNR